MRSLAANPQTVRQVGLQDKVIPSRLAQGELAERLGVDISAVRRHNKDGTLERWSRKFDPHGVGWRHQPDRNAYPSKIFVPVEENMGEEETTRQSGGLSDEQRDRILAALKVGKQSETYKRVKTELDKMAQ